MKKPNEKVEKTKAAGGGTQAASENNHASKNNGNSGFAQCARLLAALRAGPVTTIAARRCLDILHPAARVLSLRKEGHAIVTIWVVDATSEGHRHRVARYVLMHGSEK